MFKLIAGIRDALCRIKESMDDLADMAEQTRNRVRQELRHGEEPSRIEHAAGNGETVKPKPGRK